MRCRRGVVTVVAAVLTVAPLSGRTVKEDDLSFMCGWCPSRHSLVPCVSIEDGGENWGETERVSRLENGSGPSRPFLEPQGG